MADYSLLRQKAKEIRKNVLTITYNSGVNGGHVGGALSSADVLSVLYGEIMNINPDNINDENRDRFLLSKGHTAIAHYATLKEYGFISEEEMMTFEKNGTAFPTHEVINQEKGIEISSGSLGYGASIGVGIALNAKRTNKKYKVYVLLGDGECNEGSNWEAVMSAVQFKLDNLVIIVDVNNQQLDGFTKDIMPVSNISKVFEGFGCSVNIVNGNSVEELCKALNAPNDSGRPLALIMNTIKGCGIKEIEGQTGWHHVHLNEEQYNAFMNSLEERE